MSSDSFVGSIMASIGRVCRSCPMDRMIFRSKRLVVALAVVIKAEDASIRSIEPEERF